MKPKETENATPPAKKASPAGKKAGTSAATTTQNAGRGASDGMLLDFFCEELKDIYWAEKQLLKTLPKMAAAATSPELAEAFTTHQDQTDEHVARLDQIFTLLGKKAQAKKCEAMAGIVAEGESIIEDTEEGTATRDVGLVLAGQKAEHYEICTYGGLAQLARTLGQDEIAEILETTLAEEKETDSLLTQIAEANINYEASEEEAD